MAHGREKDGGPQYICRAFFDGGTHLGKVSSDSHGCVIAPGSRAVIRRSYEVLTETITWRSEFDPQPAGRPNRWGRTESVLDLYKRKRAERSAAKK